MNFVVLAKGTPSEKTVNGVKQSTIPFVGTDREGQFAEMGIGLILPDTGEILFWGLFLPRALIQSWRGMKLLEQVQKIGHGTLCYCWSVAARLCEQNHFNSLADQFGGPMKLSNTRRQLLNQAPTTKEVEAMLSILHEHRISIDTAELEAEIAAEQLDHSDLIDEFLRAVKEARQKMNWEVVDGIERQKEMSHIINSPLAPDESLGQLFADLGLNHFTNGNTDGIYMFEWNHILLEQVDREAKQACIGEDGVGVFYLKHTSKSPNTIVEQLAAGVRWHVVSFGEIRNPYYVATDGTKYTFLSTQFENGRFLVRTRIEIEGEMEIEGKYPIPTLRDMIGHIPVPSVLTRIKRRLRRLMSLSE